MGKLLPFRQFHSKELSTAWDRFVQSRQLPIDPPDPDEFDLEGLCPWCMEWNDDCHCDEPEEE